MNDQPISDNDPEQLRKCDDPEQEFMYVVESGDFDRVRRILDADPGWIGRVEKYNTPFRVAETPEMAELLLEYGANPNARGDDGMTPLHFATLEDVVLQIVPTLIAAGAELDSIDDHGCTPLTYAAFSLGGHENRQSLLKAGASYDITAAAALGDLAHMHSILEQDPDAIAKATSKEWLFAAPKESPNCPDELRVPIMRLLLEHYDWGKSFLVEQARLGTDCQSPEAKAELLNLIREYAEKSQKP